MFSPPRKVGPAGRVRARRNIEEERVRAAESARVAELAAKLAQTREKEVRAQSRYDAFIEGHRQAEEFGSAAPVVSATAELHLEAKRAKVAKMEQELAAASAAREEMEQRR